MQYFTEFVADTSFQQRHTKQVALVLTDYLTFLCNT